MPIEDLIVPPDARSPDLAQYMPMHCNLGDYEWHANIASACARDLPRLHAAPARDGVAVFVGGGPSAADFVDQLAGHSREGHTVFAMNGSAAWLRERGIVPDYHVLLDGQAHMARFVDTTTPKTHFLIASQCHPAVFDALAGYGLVTLWHPRVPGIEKHIDCPREAHSALIGGGTTVGLQALAIAQVLGFRDLHIYGYDSSFRDAAGHAYAQPENDADEPIEATVNGCTFRAARWMVQQADEFRSVAWQLAQLGCGWEVYGDGLLPAVAIELARPMDPSAACYDFAEAPASWDFANWLVTAEMDRVRRGAAAPLKVAFSAGPNGGFRADALPWSPEQRHRFFETTMRPLIGMIGAVEDQSALCGRSLPYLFHPITAVARAGEAVPRFKASAMARSMVGAYLTSSGMVRPIVITLREAAHWRQRNSNVEAWLAFARRRAAEGHDVLFVRDTEKADEPLREFPIFVAAATDPQVRAALYERAYCNLFVANGPAALTIFGDAPWLMFKNLVAGWCAGTPEWWEKLVGVRVGEQFPWSSPLQRITWTDDTEDEIEAAWADWIARIGGRATEAA